MNDQTDVLDQGPFFHGTKAELQIGDFLEPQHLSNYQDKKSTRTLPTKDSPETQHALIVRKLL